MSKNGNRPGFAVDIDNVLAGAEREVQRLFTQLTGRSWPESLFASAGGLDDSSMDRTLVEQIFTQFHEQSIPILPSLPGARFALHLLQSRYRIVIITARRPASKPQTLAWLHAHRLPFDELYMTDEKVDVPEEIALAVDDHPAHARQYSDQGIPVFLMDQPWNQGFSYPRVKRVSGWDMLLHTLHYGDKSYRPLTGLDLPPLKKLVRALGKVWLLL